MATNPEERPEERQRRELEEIRRKFQEVGACVGSMFEPAVPDDPDPEPPVLLPPAPPLDQPTRPRWQWVAAALIFVLGTGFGYLLPRSGADTPPAPTPTSRTPTSAQAPSTRAPQPAPAPKAVVPRSCLDTARRGDEVVHLLTTNVRDRRLADALKAYTLASQACRKEASP